jgi:HAD superfamily hydrolase (TIGR01509 family)
MKSPQVVVFDLGKVLVDFDYAIAVGRLLHCCTITATNLYRLLNQSTLLHEYETGLITTDQFFARVKAACGFRGELTEFGELFSDIFTPIPPMIQLHAEVRRRGIATYVFSNTNELAVQHIRKRFPFFSQFDGYIYSYEHRLMKPDPRIYEAVERCAGRRGADLLYLDDRPENVAVAAALGWQAIVHHSPEETRSLFSQMGLV